MMHIIFVRTFAIITTVLFLFLSFPVRLLLLLQISRHTNSDSGAAQMMARHTSADIMAVQLIARLTNPKS